MRVRFSRSLLGLLLFSAVLLFDAASCSWGFNYPGILGGVLLPNQGDGYCGYRTGPPPYQNYSWQGVSITIAANGQASAVVSGYNQIYSILTPVIVYGDPDCGDFSEGWQLVSTSQNPAVFPQTVIVQYYFFQSPDIPTPLSYSNWLALVQSSIAPGDDDMTDVQLAATFTNMSANTAKIIISNNQVLSALQATPPLIGQGISLAVGAAASFLLFWMIQRKT